MTKEHRQIDELFRSQLEGFELKPSAYVWDGILEKQAAARRKKRALWIRVGAVAALLLLAFLLGKELQQDDQPLNENLSVAEQKQVSPKNETTDYPESEQTDHLSETIGAGQDVRIIDTKGGQKQVRETKLGAPKTYVPVTGSKQVEYSRVTATDGDKEFEGFSFGFELLKKRIVQFGGFDKESYQLENMAQTRNGLFLTEEDRLIIARNQQAMVSSKEKASGLGWSLGARVTPVLAINETSHTKQYAAKMNASTGERNMQLGGGLTVAVETKGRWSIQSGIMYNRMGQSSTNQVGGRISGFDFAAGEDFTDGQLANSGYFKAGESTGGAVVIQAPAGTIVMNSLPQNAVIASDFEAVGTSSSNDVLMTSTEFDQFFDYIEIPLLVRYQLIDQRFGVQLMAGFNTGFLVGNSAYLNSGSGRTSIGKTSDMNAITYSSNLGLAFGYRLTPSLQLRFEPQMRYFLESLSSNPDVTYKPYTLGFYTGISYSF